MRELQRQQGFRGLLLYLGRWDDDGGVSGLKLEWLCCLRKSKEGRMEGEDIGRKGKKSLIVR